MNEKRGNIESWLKAAVQQPGPGIDRKDEEEGWAGLSAMLDDDKKRPGIIAGAAALRLRRNRWLMLTAIALVLSLLLVVSLYRSENNTRPSSNNALTNTTAGETNNTARNNSGGGTVQPPFAPPPGRLTREGKPPAEQASGAIVGQMPAEPAQKEAGRAADIADHPVDIPGRAADTPDGTDAIAAKSLFPEKLSLQTLPLPYRYAFRLPGSGLRLQPSPPSAAAAKRAPRWALQAGFLATSDEGRGLRASLMYRLPLPKHFYLEPYIGAAYTGNYDKQLRHMGVQSVPMGTGQYTADSIWTTYRVKSALSADAGIRIGYTLRRFSLGTGIRYHHILHTKGDTLSARKTGTTPSSSTYSQTFSKAAAPGRHSFYWEAELAYRWPFGLQTGISYQLLLNESTSSAWQSPSFGNSGGSSSTVPGLPQPVTKNNLQDKGRFEIYLRLPLRKRTIPASAHP